MNFYRRRDESVSAREINQLRLAEKKVISESSRLVPDDFAVRIARDQVAQTQQPGESYPGYPEHGDLIRWDDAKISAWEAAGFPDDWLLNPEVAKRVHPNYLNGLRKKADDPKGYGWIFTDDGQTDYHRTKFKPAFAGDYPRTKRGLPIHPHYRELLKNGVPAAVGEDGKVWTGFYWGVGPQLTGDPVLTGIIYQDTPDGQRAFLAGVLIRSKELVKKGNQKTLGAPGGMVEPGEPIATYTIKREIQEEAGVPEAVFDHPEIIYHGPVFEGRTGLNAWPETTVGWVHLPPEEAAKIKPVGDDDALHAGWETLSEETFGQFFSPTHVDIFKLAIRLWQENNPGLVVAKDGSIGLREGWREDKSGRIVKSK